MQVEEEEGRSGLTNQVGRAPSSNREAGCEGAFRAVDIVWAPPLVAIIGRSSPELISAHPVHPAR